MLNVIKKIIRRIFLSLLSDYGPTVLTILFALVQGLLFPDSPIWLIPLFFVLMVFVFCHYTKW